MTSFGPHATQLPHGELTAAAVNLLKRERPSLVAAVGLVFQALLVNVRSMSVASTLISHRTGIWGDDTAAGFGYPVLRSTNMRGTEVSVENAAWCDVPEGQAAEFALQDGDILVTKSSGSSDLVGKAALFRQPEDGATYLFSNFTHRLRANQIIISPEYLAWFLRSPQAALWRFESQQNAVGLRNLKVKDFLAQVVPVPELPVQEIVSKYFNRVQAGRTVDFTLPHYLEEQRRIVARIETLAASLDTAKQLREQAAQEVRAAFGARVVELFPSKTGHRKLGDFVVDCRYGTSEKTSTDSSGIPILRMGNIQDGRLDIADLKYLHLNPSERAKLLLARGDILVNRTNSAELVGKCAVFDRDEPFAFASYLIRLRLDLNSAEPRLVAAIVNSPIGRAFMLRGKKQMTGQANVNATTLLSMPLSLPPFSEQQEIIAELDIFESHLRKVRHLQDETSAELNALLPSILDRAFRGEL